QQLSSANERTSARASSQSASRSPTHGPKTSVSPTSSIACSTRHSRLPAQWTMKPPTSVADSTGSPGARISFTVLRTLTSALLFEEGDRARRRQPLDPARAAGHTLAGIGERRDGERDGRAIGRQVEGHRGDVEPDVRAHADPVAVVDELERDPALV